MEKFLFPLLLRRCFRPSENDILSAAVKQDIAFAILSSKSSTVTSNEGMCGFFFFFFERIHEGKKKETLK